MSEFGVQMNNLEALELVEEALYNLEANLDDEGIIHVLEPDKCLSVLKGLSKGQAVLTLANLLNDHVLLEETLLKIHYIYQLTKSVHDRKINLTSLAIALKGVSIQNIKFLTPQDISFIYSSLPPSKVAAGTQSVAKQIDHIKAMKEEIVTKTAALVEHDTEVRNQLESCSADCNAHKKHILDAIKGRFLSSEYSAVTSASVPDNNNNNNNNNNTSSPTGPLLSSGITSPAASPPPPSSSSSPSKSISQSNSGSELSKMTGRLETRLNKNKEVSSAVTASSSSSSSAAAAAAAAAQVSSIPATATATATPKPEHEKKKLLLHTLLNKTAEEHIARLDFDEAYDSLLAEVNKLEKKFVAQKSNKGEGILRKRMNELLLSQVELAEEKRMLREETLKNVMEYTHNIQIDVTKKRLEKAVMDVHNSEVKFNQEMTAGQEQFDQNLIDTEEYFNNLLLDINAKRIVEMQQTSSIGNKKLEMETRKLVSDTTEFNAKRLKYAEVSDELFEKLKFESKMMMEKFTKVYEATQEVIKENREIDLTDKRKMKNRKVPLQTEIMELYTDIHSLQHDFAENPILDFEIELSKVCEDHEANAVRFLRKSDVMYRECQETYMDIVLKRYDHSTTKTKKKGK